MNNKELLPKIIQILVDTLKYEESGFSDEKQICGLCQSADKIIKLMETYENTKNNSVVWKDV
jgi:hypothetical protein